MNTQKKWKLLERLQRLGPGVSTEELLDAKEEVQNIYAKALAKAVDKIEDLDAELSTLLRRYNDLGKLQRHPRHWWEIIYSFGTPLDKDFIHALEDLIVEKDVFWEVHEQHMRNTGGEY